MTRTSKYLIEPIYFIRDNALLDNSLLQIVSLCLSGFSNRYEAIFSSKDSQNQILIYGELNGTFNKKRETLMNILNQNVTPEYRLSGIYLYSKETVILKSPEAIPEYLDLSDQEFSDLQDCLLSHGLPSDIFYRSDLMKEVLMPEILYGEPIVKRMYLSPMQFELYVNESKGINIPSETERTDRFLRANEAFLQQVRIRLAELREPGKAEGGDLIRELSLLDMLITLQILRCQNVNKDSIAKWRGMVANFNLDPSHDPDLDPQT